MRHHVGTPVTVFLLVGLLRAAIAGPPSVSGPDVALLRSVNAGRLADARALLGDGAHVNARDKYAQTALMWAAEWRNAEMVRLLLAGGANVNAKDRDGLTALIWCAAGRQFGAAMNVMADRDTSDVEPESLTQAILSADDPATAAARSCGVAQLLLDHKADIRARSADGSSALSFAAAAAQPDLVRTLLRRGADAKTRDKEGETALMSALAGSASPQVTQVLALLLDAGADVNAQKTAGAHVGLTALMWAATETNSADDVRLLLAHGADVNLRQPDGWTALMAAAEFGTPESVRMLLDRGADPNARNAGGDTPLSLAAGSRRNEKVTLLKLAGATR